MVVLILTALTETSFESIPAVNDDERREIAFSSEIRGRNSVVARIETLLNTLRSIALHVA